MYHCPSLKSFPPTHCLYSWCCYKKSQLTTWSSIEIKNWSDSFHAVPMPIHLLPCFLSVCCYTSFSFVWRKIWVVPCWRPRSTFWTLHWRWKFSGWPSTFMFVRIFLFVCVWAATPLIPPSCWERIRIVRSNRVARKHPARRHSRNGPWTRV